MKTQLPEQVDSGNIDTTEPFHCKSLKSLQRVEFDPKNSQHRESYASFLIAGRWKIQFITEWPATTVPQTVLTKMAEHVCKKEIENIKQRGQLESIKFVGPQFVTSKEPVA